MASRGEIKGDDDDDISTSLYVKRAKVSAPSHIGWRKASSQHTDAPRRLS